MYTTSKSTLGVKPAQLGVKPAQLGVKPAQLVIDDRIADLTRAIWEKEMQDLRGTNDYKAIALWAAEIVAHCNSMITLEDIAKGNGLR